MKSLVGKSDLCKKRLIAYGAGMALLQMQTAAPLALEYIVDDTPGLAGKEFMGFRVFPSSQLAHDWHKSDLMVIIFANTPGAILDIAQSLNSLGFIWGENYIDCSVLQYESMKPRMRDALGIQSSEELFWRVRLLSLYTSIQSLSTIAGVWLFVELLEKAPRQGGIAECGVYKGGNAFISLMTSPTAVNRTYHLLDSFEGFSPLSTKDPISRQFDFKDVNPSSVLDLFRNFDNVRIHKGYFTETLSALRAERFAVAYLDCDLYEPTIELCEFFYPRLEEGGCLLFHDYWVPQIEAAHIRPFRGVKQAVDDFLKGDTRRLVVFPETTHAVLVK